MCELSVVEQKCRETVLLLIMRGREVRCCSGAQCVRVHIEAWLMLMS